MFWMFTRTSTPRGRRSSVGSASGFSFRLEERAEKRKEVLLILILYAYDIFILFSRRFLFPPNLRLLFGVYLSVLYETGREDPCKGSREDEFAGEIKG